MTDYQILRLCLGIAESTVAYMVIRRNVGYCFGFGILMFFSAAYNIAPSAPNEDFWKYYIQTPCLIGLLGLTIAATLDVFAFLKRRTFPRERGLLFSASAAIGCVPVAAGWFWHPENPYQAIMIARQYVFMGLAAGYLSAWVWVTCARPVRMERGLRHHGRIWACWLVCAAVMASTAKGGLWWSVFQWEGGEESWRIGSNCLMVMQMVLCVNFAVNLLRWNRHRRLVPIC